MYTVCNNLFLIIFWCFTNNLFAVIFAYDHINISAYSIHCVTDVRSITAISPGIGGNILYSAKARCVDLYIQGSIVRQNEMVTQMDYQHYGIQ